MKNTRWSRATLCAMISLLCLALAGPAFAQGTSNYDCVQPYDTVGYDGGGPISYLGINGQTHEGNWTPAGDAQVEVYLSAGGSSYSLSSCSSPSTLYYGGCKHRAAFSWTTGAYARANGRHVGTHYGGWTFSSKHWFIPSTGYYLKCQQSISKSFGPPPGACSGNGCYNTPIVVPTGNGANVKFSDLAHGRLFDLDGDGTPEIVAWPTNAAWLAFDFDGDGQITSGKELFGSHTNGKNYVNGFEALNELNSGSIELGDTAIDSLDPKFASLKLWVDENEDGIGQADELTPASQVLERIGLGYQDSGRRDGDGNFYPYKGFAWRVGGQEIPLWDVVPATSALLQ